MLISFTFSNFRSFYAQQHFTMERTEEFWSVDAPYSSVSAIYGGNAAGKSNFIAALGYVSRFVRKSFATAADEKGTGRSPYRLNPSAAAEPSTFVIQFTTATTEEYEYEFAVDDERVRYERLSKWGSSRPSKVFERRAVDTERGFDQNITYGKAFRGPRSIYHKALKENALLLSVMASADNASVADAYDFLAQRIHVHSTPDYDRELDIATRAMRDNSAQERALQLLVQNADLGINGIELDTGTPEANFERLLAQPVSDLRPELMDAGKDELTKLLARFGTQPVSSLRGEKELVNEGMAESTRSFTTTTFDEFLRRYSLLRKPTVPPQVLFAHEGKDGAALFKKHEESDGTIAAIAFLSLALRDLSTQSLTVMDEIDSSLHPSMVRALVELYQDPLTNPHGSQLVFTTHDVSLLMQAVNGEDPIGPDQFWIVEKRGGESELYPAIDYGIAEDENMARNYLNGQYGGILRPRLREAFAQALEMLEDARNEEGSPDGEVE